MFEWLFKNNNQEITDLLEVITENWNRLQLAALAQEKAVNMIANAIAKSEVVISDGKQRVRDKEYYRLNIRPNDNQTGTDFWYMATRKLLKESECLIVRMRSGMYYVADGFTATSKVMSRKVYSNVILTDGTDTIAIERTFNSDDVIHLHYGNAELRAARQNVLNTYNEAAAALEQMVTVTGTPRYKFKTEANMSFRTKDDNGNDIVLTIDKVIARLKEQLKQSGVTIIRETQGTSLEYMDIKTGIPVNEFEKMAAEINNQCAMAYDIPIDVFMGKITEKSDATNEFITYAVQPVAETISDSLNAKLVGEEDYINGERAFVWLSRFKHVDVIDSASNLDKLRGIGFSYDEIREMVGYEPLNTEWSQDRALTKNYETEGEGEGANPTGSADDLADESVIRSPQTSKHRERRKRRSERTAQILPAGPERG